MNIETLNIIILILNLLMLTWYSIETYLMRKTSQHVSKHNTEPLLMLNFTANKVHQGGLDDDMDIDDVVLTLSNIGGGVATNIRIEPLKNLYGTSGREVRLRMPQTNIIFPGTTERLAVSEYENGRRIRGGHPHPYLIPLMSVETNENISHIRYDKEASETHWNTHSYMLRIDYTDQYGKSFITKLSVDKEGIQFVY
jgi:hypothetical protein